VRAFLAEKAFITERVKERAQGKLLFRQPSILLVYMAVSKRPNDAAGAWPLTSAELKPIYSDLGESYPSE
jgi:putative GTP pyrophosphokinase